MLFRRLTWYLLEPQLEELRTRLQAQVKVERELKTLYAKKEGEYQR